MRLNRLSTHFNNKIFNPPFKQLVALASLPTLHQQTPPMTDSWARFATSTSEGTSHGRAGPRVFTGAVPYLSQEDAKQLDVDLMEGADGFSLDQLMELAGQAVAVGCAGEFPGGMMQGSEPAETCAVGSNKDEDGGKGIHNRVCVAVGPGNNGGDGWVAARHLAHFGYQVTVINAPGVEKTAKKFSKLVSQCKQVGVGVVEMDELPEENSEVDFLENVKTLAKWFHDENFLFVVDAMLGFSAVGEPKGCYKRLIKAFTHLTNVVSVDIPSGWDVEEGDKWETGFSPRILISLTAPKLGTKNFLGKHLLGGRFLPLSLKERYNLHHLPNYLGTDYVTIVHGARDQGAKGKLGIGSSLVVGE